ncbi:BrnT family toxin [Pistricoccus aurantiacus]|uniref:BrnT family toxin n=1 Tax=Pistricoccus aurantiacus TaxID=1883414 RepID=UPI003643EFF7
MRVSATVCSKGGVGKTTVTANLSVLLADAGFRVLLLEIRAKLEDEQRFLLIGQIDGKHWSAVVAYREGRTRLISVRRSRKQEVELYES